MADRTYFDWNATAPAEEARIATIAALDVAGNALLGTPKAGCLQFGRARA
jgi:hypothetical protein